MKEYADRLEAKIDKLAKQLKLVEVMQDTVYNYLKAIVEELEDKGVIEKIDDSEEVYNIPELEKEEDALSTMFYDDYKEIDNG